MENIINLDRKEFELRFSPKHTKKVSNGLIPLIHPEFFINDKMNVTIMNPESDEVDLDKIGIRVNLLITNFSRDGFWLVKHDKTNEITIPGGLVTKDLWTQQNLSNPWQLLIRTAIIGFVNGNRRLEDSLGRDLIRLKLQEMSSIELHHMIPSLLKRVGLEVMSPRAIEPFQMFYQYFMRTVNADSQTGNNGFPYQNSIQTTKEITVYFIVEVAEPDNVRKPAFVTRAMSLLNDRILWYSKEDHQYYQHAKGNYDAFDIRQTNYGRMILDDILHTQEVFGFLNIY